jgi:hypothetical protein
MFISRSFVVFDSTTAEAWHKLDIFIVSMGRDRGRHITNGHPFAGDTADVSDVQLDDKVMCDRLPSRYCEIITWSYPTKIDVTM